GVLAELQLDRPAERRVARQLQRRLLPVAARLDQRAEPEALERLGHRAPVPSESPGGRLHVEAVLAQRGEDRGVAPGLVAARFPGRQAQVLGGDLGAVGKRQGLAQTVLELAGVAGPVALLERREGGRGQSRGGPPRLGGRLLEESRCQQRDVLPALAKRRQSKDEPLEPEIEIL